MWLALALSPGVLRAQAPVSGGGVLSGCEVPGYDGPARCGSVAVAEDPSDPAGRRLALNVVVLDARGPDSVRVPDPVFVLDGGPGLAATRAVEWVARDLAVVLETRDVVLVDRRGTGESNALDCPAASPSPGLADRRSVHPRERAAECRRSLEGRADLTKYTSPFAVDDLDAVREALGYERINLYGGSYGSREAFEYMRRHGAHLRSGAVFAVTPQHRPALLRSPATAELALQRLIDDCMADRECRTAYPDLRTELRAVVERLSAEPAPFTVPRDGGGVDTLALTRTRFGAVVRTLLLSPAGGAQVPYLISLSHGGDYQRVGGLYARLAGQTEAAASRGLFLSVVCAEEARLLTRQEVRAAAEGTFWGPGWPESVMDQCEEWSAGELPPGWHEPPEGDTPFLLMAGWLDPIAAPAWAAELTRWMPNARRVLVREGHHNFPLGACGREALARFYDTADPFALDAGCIAGTERPPFLVP
ncbi:MAG: alpha/beta fold hydrolase [Candidatus Longimicrobiales bacterium M2_2A_002]